MTRKRKPAQTTTAHLHRAAHGLAVVSGDLAAARDADGAGSRHEDAYRELFATIGTASARVRAVLADIEMTEAA